jgi:hypothetical protein
MHRARVYGDDPILVSKLVKKRQARHIICILITAMQEDDDWIMLLLVIACWQMYDVVAGDVIHIDFLFRILRGQSGHDEKDQGHCDHIEV